MSPRRGTVSGLLCARTFRAKYVQVTAKDQIFSDSDEHHPVVVTFLVILAIYKCHDLLIYLLT